MRRRELKRPTPVASKRRGFGRFVFAVGFPPASRLPLLDRSLG
jgi:hypothetical protein